MLKIVLDSSVLISAFINATKGGASNDLLHILLNDPNYELYTSEYILNELEYSINSERLRKYTKADENQIKHYLQAIRLLFVIMSDLPEISVSRDTNDDPIIATAIKAKANYLITRDKDLLVLSPFDGIKIILPENFLTIIR